MNRGVASMGLHGERNPLSHEPSTHLVQRDGPPDRPSAGTEHPRTTRRVSVRRADPGAAQVDAHRARLRLRAPWAQPASPARASAGHGVRVPTLRTPDVLRGHFEVAVDGKETDRLGVRDAWAPRQGDLGLARFCGACVRVRTSVPAGCRRSNGTASDVLRAHGARRATHRSARPVRRLPLRALRTPVLLPRQGRDDAKSPSRPGMTL